MFRGCRRREPVGILFVGEPWPAQVVLSFDQVGIERQRVAVTNDRRIESSAASQDVPEIRACRDILRVQFQGGTIVAQGLVGVGPLQDGPEIAVAGGACRPEIHRRPKVLEGRLPVLQSQHHPESRMCGRQRPVWRIDGLFDARWDGFDIPHAQVAPLCGRDARRIP